MSLDYALDAVANIFGFVIILTGVALFAYGGFVFVRDTARVMVSPQLQANIGHIREKDHPEETKAARLGNLRILWQAWKPGLRWMGLGYLLIGIGSPLTWEPPPWRR